jgi:hypothetical protein
VNKLRALLLFCFMSTLAFSQAVDIRFNSIGPYNDLARGVAWGATGVGNSDNSYIFPPSNPQETTCVYISNNNPTSAHAFTLSLRYSGDPRTTGYLTSTTQQGRWKNVSILSDTVQPLATNNYSFSSPGAAWAQVQISGTSPQTGSPDTVDIYLVQTASNCGSAAINVPQPAVCNQTSVNAFGAGPGQVLLASVTPPAGQYVRVCAYSITEQTLPTAGGEILFATSATGSCTTAGAADHWGTLWNSTTFQVAQLASLAQIFQTNAPAQPLCIKNNTTGGLFEVTVSYYIG